MFMDDFSIVGESFDNCLKNLRVMLVRYEETNMVLNWEKCHFMVREGIVLGHRISAKGIEVDRAKIEAIKKLPPPTSVKSIRSFLPTLVSIGDSSRISLRLQNRYPTSLCLGYRLSLMRTIIGNS